MSQIKKADRFPLLKSQLEINHESSLWGRLKNYLMKLINPERV